MCKKKILKNYSIVKEKKMRDFNNKLKVFISSKTGNTPADEKYVLARVAAKETLESTGLFKVYSFESEGPSVNSALEHYTEGLKDSDVCIFLIDNKDDVPKGVQIEIDTVNKYQIPSLYYFCQGEEKEKTQAELDLRKPTKSKYTIINSFSEFIEKCALHLVDDVLLTYKLMIKSKGGQDDISEEDKIFQKKSEDSNIEAGIIESNNNLVLGKEKLVNEMCRNFFSNLLFGKKTQQIDKKDFDFYCSKYLLTMFKHTTIEEFNMNLFLESLSKILPPPYYEIVEKRWISNQKYYLEEYDASLILLKEALALAEDNNGKVAEWLIQDILIDLRNRENNIAETKNQYLRKTEGQKGLDNRQEKLYYPLIDRNEKNLLEWIEKERHKNEMRSYSSWSSYGDLSFLSDYIADIYYQAMMFGSLTHLNRVYSLIQNLTYQLSKFSDYWPWVMTLLSTTIVTLDRKKTTQITRHFGKLLEKMNPEDAKKVYQFSNNAKPQHNKFIANLIAMSEVGYYLNDNDFEQYWDSLKSQIDSWAKEENSMVSLQPYVFQCLKKINDRIDDNYILEFGLSLLESSKIRYHLDVLELLAGNNINYELVSVDNLNRTVQTLIKYATENNDFNELKGVQIIFTLMRNANCERQQEMEAFLQSKWPDFYSREYMFEKNKGKQSQEVLIESKIEDIHNRNLTQGKNGIYSGYGTNPYLESEGILTTVDEKIGGEMIDELFIATSNTVLSTDQLVEDKLNAYRLVIFLIRYDVSLIERNEEVIARIIQFQDYESASESMMSHVDSTMLILSHLLLECLGKNKFSEIAQILSVFTDSGNQVEACKMLQTFLYNYKNYNIRANLESLFLQCSLLWTNSDNIDVRWHNTHLQLTLIEKKKYRKLIGKNLQSIMESDNAIVKSQIVHKIDLINNLDKKLGKAIFESAKDDNNFVIRKIANIKIR